MIFLSSYNLISNRPSNKLIDKLIASERVSQILTRNTLVILLFVEYFTRNMVYIEYGAHTRHVLHLDKECKQYSFSKYISC